VVDGSGLENRRRGNPTGGSNPSLSATQSSVFYLRRHLSRIAQVRPHSMHSYANPTTEKAQDNAFESIRKSFLCSYLGSSVRRTRNQSQVRIQAAKIPTGSSNSRFPATQSPGLLSPATSPKNRANSPHSTHSSVNRTREITSRQRF
jgi:hypothetical protein